MAAVSQSAELVANLSPGGIAAVLIDSVAHRSADDLSVAGEYPSQLALALVFPDAQ